MPRFGVAFRRKSTATSEDFQNASVVIPEQSSFRVIERNDPSINRSFDGGARMARASGNFVPKPTHLDLEDNMFADLKVNNRGSGASNTTKTTSTDASSRHSNASTAPSSADFPQDEWKHPAKKPLHEVPPRSAPKSSGSGFLNRAGRTFSFGQKKHGSSSPSKEEAVPDVPPVPTFTHEDFSGRARGFTESTSSTATPPKLEENGNLDMGGDFGSMFSSFDKRASMATLKMDGTAAAPRSLTNPRSAQPTPITIDKTSTIDPSPQSWNSRTSNDGLLGGPSAPGSPDMDVPPPVPRHQQSFKTSNRPSDIIEDEDAKLLSDSIAVGRLLSDSSYTSRYQREEDTFSSAFARKPVASGFKKDDDNMFEGSLAHSSRVAHRYTSRAPSPPRNKVMTPAQFEKYRKDKERTTSTVDETRKSVSNDDDEEDEINYEDDEDEIEKSKQQAKQRRKQEAHMAVYRQQMMKVTGEQPDLNPIERPPLPMSMSAPQLSQIKTPSPGPADDEEEEDDEVPLAILQAHGFPNRNRPPTRLSTMGSNPNLRASAIQRPGSVMGEAPPATTAQRSSALPAFARNLPQDPFVGASIAKPAVRESLQFSGGAPATPPLGSLPPSQSQQSLHPGGLVGVIASEERSRAMRRGSPNIDGQKLLPNMNAPPGWDPINGIPPQMMYNNGMGGPGGMQGMNGMNGMNGMGAGMLGMGQMPPQPPMLTVGDQAQLQMTQQMSQFMQMQMQFMQMMATNQNQNQLQANGQMAQPYGGLTATQSMNDLSSSRMSMMGEPMMEPPRRLDVGMRTMSMVGPPSGAASFIQHPGYAGSIRASGMGYAPSIAPSERSNIGLPGRYRPVSQAPSALNPDSHRRTNTMSGALSNRWEESKSKSTINIVTTAGDGSDDDDEEGWEAMKAKRDKKRSMWKSKKGGFGSELSAMI